MDLQGKHLVDALEYKVDIVDVGHDKQQDRMDHGRRGGSEAAHMPEDAYMLVADEDKPSVEVDMPLVVEILGKELRHRRCVTSAALEELPLLAVE